MTVILERMRGALAPAGLVLLCAAAFIAAPVAPAAAQQCGPPPGYPGDAAPKDAIATWMSQAAVARAVPGELPVMAALVESGLTNLAYGDADSAGYFQMRVPIWSRDYPGFPENPELQIKWFLDQAEAVRAQRIAGGDPAYGKDPSRYGEWIADVIRPPEQYRGRYQPRLEEARALIRVVSCPGLPADPGPLPPGADRTPPALAVPVDGLKLRRGGLDVGVGCPAEACTVGVSASVVVRTPTASRAARVYRLSSEPRQLAGGTRAKVRLRFTRQLRRAIAASLRAGYAVRAKLRVLAVDDAGNVTAIRRATRIRPSA
jgi:hypothetical protein